MGGTYGFINIILAYLTFITRSSSFISLTQAEAAFRIQKDPLSIRPIWHQNKNRVEAHILVCFLAFAIWKMLEMWQEQAGLGNSPRTILEELSRIYCHDLILPTEDGTEISDARGVTTKRSSPSLANDEGSAPPAADLGTHLTPWFFHGF